MAVIEHARKCFIALSMKDRPPAIIQANTLQKKEDLCQDMPIDGQPIIMVYIRVLFKGCSQGRQVVKGSRNCRDVLQELIE